MILEIFFIIGEFLGIENILILELLVHFLKVFELVGFFQIFVLEIESLKFEGLYFLTFFFVGFFEFLELVRFEQELILEGGLILGKLGDFHRQVIVLFLITLGYTNLLIH